MESKYGMNKLICETERDSETDRTDLWLPRVRGGWTGSLGLADVGFYIQKDKHQALLYSTVNYIQSVKVKVAQSCVTLFDPVDYSVHGILQARILEWVAYLFSRGSSD